MATYLLYTNTFHLLFAVFCLHTTSLWKRIHFCNKTSSDGHLLRIIMRITHFGCWRVNFKNDEISDDSLTPSRSHTHRSVQCPFSPHVLFRSIVLCLCAREFDAFFISNICDIYLCSVRAVERSHFVYVRSRGTVFDKKQ